MRVAPDSVIHVLKNIPLSMEYRDTIYFGDKTAQERYFSGKKKYSFINYSYLRKEEVIRVEMLADNLLDCNYIMFKNSAFGNKWFYAFITNVEYVNNTTSNISYVVDVMQTWAFDYKLQRCFVEREHTTTDIIGDNLLEDNLELGEYKYEDLGISNIFTSLYSFVVASTFKQDGSKLVDAQGGLYGGVYSGLYYNIFNDYKSVNAFLEQATLENKADGIVNIYMIPTVLGVDESLEHPELFEVERDKYYDRHNGTIDGYKPKNKKIFTYPYCMLYVTNNNGTSANYPFEYFGDTTCHFTYRGLMNTVPQVVMYPLNYKGVAENYNERMMLKDFPQCAYNIDSFKAYLAQNASQLGTATAIGLISAGLSYSPEKPLGNIKGTSKSTSLGNPIPYMGVELGAQEIQPSGFNGSFGGLSATAMMLARIADKATLPPQARGGESGNINTALGKNGFQFYYCFVRQEYAVIIDNFWTMYGYPCRRVKVPNINARPHWTYTKTVDSCITGSIPAGDLMAIKNVFNNGITFWKNANEVGNYGLDNSPA